MTRPITRELARDVHEGLDDVGRAVTRAGRRIREHGRTAASERMEQAGAAARRFAVEARETSTSVARRAVREARARPMVAAAALAALAGFVAVLMAARRRA
ncbi:MAG: hypothetical protein KGO51_02100 [Alphaproteobacteria bacterium]|nr:hypothetical protein [Alphaproteobacteria bacterium]